ncbi:C-type lectin domain-containing protein [Caenorhabditis elegans]|uniref:C-type lectin domain-containing protein n=1 Tax=Caenorhabditis elegans TaxID=6239 RepID=Q9N4W5_CAEEL|nr:C-type lectin domain-containing protein [Caenorhabditis elegans]CCD70658.1 C-type lectin domain-containing protein [Caenorhabditis elegans]|eukprot:NP_503499.2 C-type LECtin [Caenorhabditis elegans]
MNLLPCLLIFLLYKQVESDDCANYILNSNAVSLNKINGKCIAVPNTAFSGSAAASCSDTGNGVQFVKLSIDSKEENDFVANGLKAIPYKMAYIGLGHSVAGWEWMNGDSSIYRNWAHPPDAPTAEPTTEPSTLPPAEQRRSTAVVIGIDASLFSTNSLTFAQVEFARSLSAYIGARGPAEFAFFAYGCAQMSPYMNQYPNFVSTFVDTDTMIRNLNETINHDCVRTNPLDFRSMFRDQTVYYNRYTTSYRPFKSQFLSMIYFSSSTDSDNIKAASSLYPMADSSVITINIGDKSIDISPLSIPVGKNGIRVKTADDILGLVPKIDSMIFGTTAAAAGGASKEFKEPSIDATTYTDCAYMNVTDKLWYSDGECTTERQVLCQYVLPTPPTPNPTISWQDPCFYETTTFKYFESLHNAKCYRVSSEKKQFVDAENLCLSKHPLFLHTPKLTSIETKIEEDQVRTLIHTQPLVNEGMFWFGLKRDPSNSSNWYFINGDTYDSSYQNWRSGYPRDADGCDCVALVINDNSWVNTDCNKQLYSICAFQFNFTDTAF